MFVTFMKSIYPFSVLICLGLGFQTLEVIQKKQWLENELDKLHGTRLRHHKLGNFRIKVEVANDEDATSSSTTTTSIVVKKEVKYEELEIKVCRLHNHSAYY